MPSNKNININYTSREFDSIKEDLINYAKKYYPNKFKDFNEGSFGSLITDMVAYVGDSLSFLLDYSVNESFLQNSNEIGNVLRHARALGYKHKPLANSFGTVEVRVLIPSQETEDTPNTDYLPMIKRGSTFTTGDGNVFTLSKDIDFTDSNTTYITGELNANGNVNYFIAKNTGTVISGEIVEELHELGEFSRFQKVFLNDENATEIVSVVDSAGNSYYQVEYLSQDVIYKIIANNDPSSNTLVPSILKPMAVPRRFTLERDDFNQPYLQFGSVSNKEILNEKFIDPNEVVAELHARDYYTDKHYDPSNFFINDKFGIAPSNTALLVRYRKTNSGNVNVAANSLTAVNEADISFKNEITIPSSVSTLIRESLSVNNPSPILGDTDPISIDEAKILAFDSYATQNRAVTKNDYISLTYRMPSELGSVKRTNVFQDNDSFKRNLNMFVLSEDSNGNLITTPAVIKNNLKTWLNQYKMINDTVDIMDAHVVNIAIDFVMIPQPGVNKYDALTAALEKLQEEMLSPKYNIGEPFYVTDVYQHLKEVPEVLDVFDVIITNKSTSEYSSVYYSIEDNMSADGRILNAKENVCFEIKYASDIKGAII